MCVCVCVCVCVCDWVCVWGVVLTSYMPTHGGSRSSFNVASQAYAIGHPMAMPQQAPASHQAFVKYCYWP